MLAARGQIYFELNRFEEAVAAYKRLAVLRPASAEIQLVTGLCLYNLERFGEANAVLTDPAVADSPQLAAARVALRCAVTELQFQDMASQLIWHTTKVLQGCAFRLASEAMGNEDGEEAAPFAEMAPDRPNPVTQSEMDAGSIDLF